MTHPRYASDPDWFAKIVERAPDAIIIIDEHGSIVRVNAETERLFDYPRSSLDGQPVTTLIPERRKARERVAKTSYFHDTKLHKKRSGLELAGLRGDGSQFPIEVRASPIDDGHGKFAIVTVRDISERKAAQDELSDYARNLEASNRELEEFAYVASHDLQAPLRNIISFSELLQEECLGKVNDDADQYFEYIEESAQRLQTLIRDILEVSRVNRSGRSFTNVDVGACVAACIEQLKPLLDESGGHVEYADLPEVTGEEMRLTQLFQNLLANAIKFQRPNAAPYISVTARAIDNFWEFAVSDNGIGIAEGECAHVFEIFRRLHTADEYEGTGIGLSICKKIVETHGGHIQVESPNEYGTTFKFTLLSADTNSVSATPKNNHKNTITAAPQSHD